MKGWAGLAGHILSAQRNAFLCWTSTSLSANTCSVAENPGAKLLNVETASRPVMQRIRHISAALGSSLFGFDKSRLSSPHPHQPIISTYPNSGDANLRSWKKCGRAGSASETSHGSGMTGHYICPGARESMRCVAGGHRIFPAAREEHELHVDTTSARLTETSISCRWTVHCLVVRESPA